MEELNNYFKENRITHKVIAPYSPEQNRKVKRVNHTIIDLIWAILIIYKFPKSFWAEIVKTIVYSWNQSSINQGILLPHIKI